MNPKSKIQKGKLLENYVADQLREKGIDPRAQRAHGSGNTNTEKADIWTSAQILGISVGIECKNHQKVKLWEFWRQTKELEKLDREPVLVMKEPHAPLGDSVAVIYLDTLLELIKNQK